MGNSPSIKGTDDGEDEDTNLPTLNDVPRLLEEAQSSEVEKRWEALTLLEVVRQADPEAAVELITPLAVQLASSLENITDENEVIVSIQLVWGTFLTNDAARAALDPHSDAMLSVLAGRNANESTRNTVYSLLEELFASEQASTYIPIVTARLTSMISAHEDDRAILSGFYLCSAFGWSLSTKVLLNAGAFELAQESLSSTNKDVYAQAQGILSFYLTDTDFQELVGKDVASLRESIIRKFVDLIFNVDAAFADPVVEKLTGLEEEDKALMLSLVGDKWWRGLVWRLQFKNPDMFGVPEEWALVRQTDEKDPEPVIAAFKDILKGDKYKTQEKLAVVNGLLMSFDGIRKAAIKGGFGEFIVDCVNNGDTKVVVQALRVLEGATKGSQQTGALVLSMDNAIGMLFNAITSQHDETRHLAYGVLTSLCDAYSIEGKSLRNHAKEVFSSPNRLPIITGAFEHAEKQTAGLAATLLAEMLLSEDGSESWNYDADQGGPPPDTPFKTQLFTPAVIRQVIGLLQSSESAAGALYLLSQGCWGNQKVYDMIKEGFGAYVKNADAAFFARLSKPCPTKHRHVKVAQAAYEAGAIERVWSLLQQELRTPEERIDIIDALCIFLSTDKGGEDGLVEQVRANGKVEAVMTALVADESEDALQSFLWMMRILGKGGEEDEWVAAWTGLSRHDAVVPHLSKMLEIGVGDVGMEEPDAEKMDRGYRLAKRKYDEAVAVAQQRPDKILDQVLNVIKFILPVLGKNAEAFIHPLILRSSDKYQTILEVVQKISLVDGFDPKPLVTAMDEALNEATSWEKLKAWCDVGPTVGAAVVKTTAISRLIRDISGEETEGVDPPDAVPALAAIVKAVALDDANAVKKAFFDNENAVKKALLIAGGALGEGYAADLVTGALSTLAEDYPKGLEVLASPDLISVALTRFDDPDTASPQSLAPLIGYACGLEPSYRQTVVELVRGYLDAFKPPQEEEKKKKRKKKAKEMRMGFYDTWTRMKALARTTLEARKVLLDAGAIEAVTRVLEMSDNEDDRDTVIRFLRILATSRPADGLMSCVAPVLPAMRALFLKQVEHPDLILDFLRDFMPDHLDVIVSGDGDFVEPLVVATGEFPSCFHQDKLFELVEAIAEMEEGGYEGVVECLGRCFMESDERVVEVEEKWGFSYSVKVFVRRGGALRRAAVEAGAVEYILRIVQMENMLAVANGAGAAAVLMLEMPEMKDSLVDAVLEHVKVKVEEARRLAEQTYPGSSPSVQDTTDGEDDAFGGMDVEELNESESEPENDAAEREMFADRCAALVRNAETMDKAIAVLQGESDEFDE